MSLQKRRIAFVVSFWSLGGAPQVAAKIAAALEARGHEVEVLYLYRRSEHPLPPGPCALVIDRDVSVSLGYLLIPWLLFRRLRRFRPDTVISFSPLAHVLGQVVAVLSGVRGRVAAHRVVCSEYKPVLRFLDRVLGTIGAYTGIAAVSNAVEASVAGYPLAYRRKVRVIHNGVSRIPSPMGRAQARAAFNLPAEEGIVLAVGRLADQKNYPLLIDAVSRLERTHLVVAGSGQRKAALESQAAALGMSDRLHLLGHLSKEALSDLFRACDLFALASTFEGQSNALLEAMAEGMPIVASDIPEQIETLRGPDGRDAGILLPVNDPNAWTDAIRRTLGDPGLRQCLSDAARERARHFTFDRMIDGFEQVAGQE
ncbi:glycosyltransferase family 4 protein [Emcibacter sp. SYSU 3D8]|uniref:glycosyltransferase family 4 protein n=1 Tax=Emcibacter sp. SYSU 3D8 TaxID=3133969 RepID=UPI0031FEBFC0